MLTAFAVNSLLQTCELGAASVILQSLDGGPSVRIRAEAELYPASMIKLPIAMAVARFVKTGTLRWEESVTVRPRNLTANDASSPFVAGYTARLGECVRAMISRSDNVATNVLIDVIGRDVLTLGCREIGLERTAVRRKLSGALPLIDDPTAIGRNAHPPSDAALLFQRLAREARTHENLVHEALLAQYWNDKLSRGWGARDTFAHKTGDTSDTSHDGGVLTLADGRRYIVVVYTALPANPETGDRFAAFARAVRPLLAGR